MTRTTTKTKKAATTKSSTRSAELWSAIVPSRIAADQHGRLALFRAALASLDRAEQAAAVLAAEGLMKKDGTVHPLIQVEQEARVAFMRTWQALGLHRDLQRSFNLF